LASIVTAPPFRPPAGSGVFAFLAWRVLRLFGWCVVLPAPVPLKCVVVVYPHTSNWDFLIGLLAQWALRIRFRWVGKDTMFDSPLRPLYLHWGGIPVNRRERTGFADAMRGAFLSHDDFRLAIAPEATRGYAEHWKSGFYHIARAAGVPLALAFIDYARREIGFIGCIDLSGDMAADMERIGALYRGKTGKNPEQQAPIRLRATRTPDA
jgi:1-acyl-sn-glycerol-3-phosphate acyltransferase